MSHPVKETLCFIDAEEVRRVDRKVTNAVKRLHREVVELQLQTRPLCPHQKHHDSLVQLLREKVERA
jgi:hypothetical protein